MTKNCTNCGLRWTGNVRSIVIDGRPAKLFSCVRCNTKATQRVRVAKPK